jgi:hypothetical protein
MESSVESFEKILRYSGISKVYFVDDYLQTDFSIDNVIAVTVDILSRPGGEEIIIDSLKEFINLTKVPPQEISNIIKKFCEETSTESKRGVEQIIFNLSDKEYLKKSKLTSRIVEMFPGKMALGIHPSKWDEIKSKDLQADSSKSQVLILFDQDLSNADGFELRTGIQLIAELKKEPYFNKLTCILISNDIEETKDELPTRKKLLLTTSDLTDSDFFPLSKKRMEVDDHFYDGIKKSLLNSHCEIIKAESSKIIIEAYKRTLDRVKEMNTYDFDHTIFQSSYEEGVWEAETLFRISQIIFDEEIKKEIIVKGFQKNVNGFIRESKRLSDIRFKIGSDLGEPYSEKYKLRHSEIYEAGEIINKLHKPIDNGDIFEIYEGDDDSKGYYILIGQECDLMVRNPSGERESKLGYLFKVAIYRIEEFYELIKTHYEENKRDFFDSKFQLDYIISGQNNVGIISFKKPVIIDLKILELVVFNEDGEASFDTKKNIDTSVLSFAWEARYNKAMDFFNTKAGWATNSYNTLKKLKDPQDKSVVEHLTSLNRLKLSIFRAEVGSARTLDKGMYKFGMRRVLNFRNPGSAILLDTYTKYQSRSAPPHDFAIIS